MPDIDPCFLHSSILKNKKKGYANMTFEQQVKLLIEENITAGGQYAFFKNCWYNLYGDYLQLVKFEKESYGYFSVRYRVQPLYIPLVYYEKWNEFEFSFWDASCEYSHAYHDEEINMMKAKDLCMSPNTEKCAMLLRDYVNPRLTVMADPTALFERANVLDRIYIKAALGEYEQTCAMINTRKEENIEQAKKERKRNMSEDYCANLETFMDRVFGPMIEAIQVGACDTYLKSIQLKNLDLLQRVVGLG